MTQTTAATNAKAPAPKQLKKLDFLNVIGATAMTRENIVDSLTEFAFIPSYIDYLTEHFIATGKIVRNEDGTVNLKPGKVAGTGTEREVYAVVYDDEGTPQLETRVLAKGEHLTKDLGFYATKGKAVKVASQAIFAKYKADSDAVKALVPKAEAEVAEAE